MAYPLAELAEGILTRAPLWWLIWQYKISLPPIYFSNSWTALFLIISSLMFNLWWLNIGYSFKFGRSAWLVSVVSWDVMLPSSSGISFELFLLVLIFIFLHFLMSLYWWKKKSGSSKLLTNIFRQFDNCRRDSKLWYIIEPCFWCFFLNVTWCPCKMPGIWLFTNFDIKTFLFLIEKRWFHLKAILLDKRIPSTVISVHNVGTTIQLLLHQASF